MQIIFMNLSIATTAVGGHMILYVIDGSGATILKLTDFDSGTVILMPGHTYRFEWHVWGTTDADYGIQAIVDPDNPGFSPFNYAKQYTGAHRDMGGFFFTV